MNWLVLKKQWVVIFLLSCFFGSGLIAAKRTLVILDFDGREAELYRPFIELAQSVDITMAYVPLDVLLDAPVVTQLVDKVDGAFIVLSRDLLANLQHDFIPVQRLHALLEYFAYKKGAFVGILFPSFGQQVMGASNLGFMNNFAPIFDHFSKQVPLRSAVQRPSEIDTAGLQAQNFFYAAHNFLTHPFASRPVLYRTTLREPVQGITIGEQLPVREEGEAVNPVVLPSRGFFGNEVQALLPYGLYWFNEVRQNHLFIGWQEIITACSISENFRLCPMDYALRKKIFKSQQELLWELVQLLNKKDVSIVRNITTWVQKKMRLHNTVPRVPPLPSYCDNFGKSLPYKKKNAMRKIAWMELPVFMPKKQNPTLSLQAQLNEQTDRARRQQELVNYCVQSELDTLWITFNPHMLFSPIGRERDKKTATLQAISLFTRMLKNCCNANKKPVPAILVGFEVANNVYAPHLPKNYAVDMYGGEYKDMPAPLDRAFWQQEVVQPCKDFVSAWRDKAVSNGIPLAGIGLDLELYCRKKTGQYSTIMGFDQATLHKFADKQAMKLDTSSTQQAVVSLVGQHAMRSYFNFLTDEARDLGRFLRNAIREIMPQATLMCYMPNIAIDWFYKGLMQGLSTDAAQPLSLCTFNVESVQHQEWFKRNNIYMTHASVVLLSKLSAVRDVALVRDVLKHNDGVWLNRFSRMVEDYDATSWTCVEQSPLQATDKSNLMDLIATMR